MGISEESCYYDEVMTHNAKIHSAHLERIREGFALAKRQRDSDIKYKSFPAPDFSRYFYIYFFESATAFPYKLLDEVRGIMIRARDKHINQ